MKSEVSFFKDKRFATPKEIIACYRFAGFTDKEIIHEMKKIIALRHIKIPPEFQETLDVLEASNSDVSMTQNVLINIKTEGDNEQ